MDAKTMELVNKGAPWRRDVPWPVIAAEAVALAAIGIYMVVDTSGASDIFLQLVGLALLITSVLVGYAAFRTPEGGLGTFDAFRSGIGVTTGLIVVISWWSDYIEKEAQRNILGWGLVAYTILHLIGLFVVRGRGNIRPSAIVISLLTLVLGVLLITGDDTASDSRLTTLGVILIVFGVALGGLAFYIYNKTKSAPAAPAAS